MIVTVLTIPVKILEANKNTHNLLENSTIRSGSITYLSVMERLDMLVQQILHVENFSADGTPELLRVSSKMKLQFQVSGECLTAVSALRSPGLRSKGRSNHAMNVVDIANMHAEFDLRVEYCCGVGTSSTTKHFTLVAVLHSKMHLNLHLGIKDFLAQATTVQMQSVDVHQVFLEFVRFWECFPATLTTVLGGSSDKMREDMLFTSGNVLKFPVADPTKAGVGQKLNTLLLDDCQQILILLHEISNATFLLREMNVLMVPE